MASIAFGRANYVPLVGRKDSRRSSRRRIGAAGWLRLDGGFAARACDVLDLSDTGVRISTKAAAGLTGSFTLLLARNGGGGRRARIKWKHGSQIGAEFI